jgi:GNAT superfamily N-acetyltransferase
MDPGRETRHADSGTERPGLQRSAGYPAELECEGRTGDGEAIRLRPIRPDDGRMLREFHERLSDQSIYHRYFVLHRRLSSTEVEHLTNVDYVDRLALVVEDDGCLVAVGRYERLPGTKEAEVAFVVADNYQHRGLGSLLLHRLADAARERGIENFTAETLAENKDMIRVFMHSGFPVTTTTEWGTVYLRFPIVKTPVAK